MIIQAARLYSQRKKHFRSMSFQQKFNNIPKFNSWVLVLGIYGGQTHKLDYMFSFKSFTLSYITRNK